MSINPDFSKFVIRFRKGKPILVDRQILRWRAARAKMKAQAKKELAKTTPNTLLDALGGSPVQKQGVVEGVGAKSMKNLFGGDVE